MTEVSTEPVAAPAATPHTTPPPTPTNPAPTAPEQSAGKKVEHTAGGWPVVPLAVTGANSTIGVVAASALAAGPVGAAVAAAGAAVVATTTAVRRRSKTRKAGRPRSGAIRKAAGARTGGAGRGLPSQGLTTASRSTGATSRTGSGAKPVLGKGRSAGGASTPGANRAGSGLTRSASGAGRGTLGKSGGGSTGRVSQVKGLRDTARKQAPSRHAARTDTGQARRSVADARRAARAGSTTSPAKARSGLIGRAGKATAGKARSVRDAAIGKGRTAQDLRAATRLESSRDRVRKAARAALRRSAGRKQGRRLMAALLAAPLGVLGMLSTPLGKRLGWAWLQQPGRRLYQHMMRSAEEHKAARDAAIRERLAAEEKALDDVAQSDAPEIGDTVQRPFHLLPATNTTPVEVVSMSGFRFEEAAAEMENAARTYEPENSMEILSMVENLPDALTSVANTFRILAERSDSEFPLEKDIAGAFDEIYGALMRAVDASADLGELFRQVHDHDIARHEDPRNGPEAEKGWNV